ncbi:MAG: conjugative transposon protein TraM [Sphingobacteriales bacterium]|nr:conjugative transposon protein TraM [Sphingobacteriales bacterium]
MKKIFQLKGKNKWMLALIGLVFCSSVVLGYKILFSSSEEKPAEGEKGLNPDLPGARLKGEENMDKLSFYEQAEKDSAKMEELMRNDPYYQSKADTVEPSINELEELTEGAASKYNRRLRLSPYQEVKSAPEAEVLRKLSILQKELDKGNETASEEMESEKPSPGSNGLDTDLGKLEGMISQLRPSDEGDPEINQLSSVMDKILDVQHPERVKEKLAKIQEAVYAVRSHSGGDTISDGFYSWSEEKETEQPNTIEAVVHGDQVLVNGSVIKFRLLAPVYIRGSCIAAGAFVNGLVSLNNERLEIVINAIRSGKSVYSIQLEVFDLDGLPGIYIPGAITREAAKQSAEQSMQILELRAMDPGIKAQAAATGVGAIKNLLSKKVKLLKVMVKSGYQVLLKNKNI